MAVEANTGRQMFVVFKAGQARLLQELSGEEAGAEPEQLPAQGRDQAEGAIGEPGTAKGVSMSENQTPWERAAQDINPYRPKRIAERIERACREHAQAVQAERNLSADEFAGMLDHERRAQLAERNNDELADMSTIDGLRAELAERDATIARLREALEKSGWQRCGCPGHWKAHAGCAIAEVLAATPAPDVVPEAQRLRYEFAEGIAMCLGLHQTSWTEQMLLEECRSLMHRDANHGSELAQCQRERDNWQKSYELSADQRDQCRQACAAMRTALEKVYRAYQIIPQELCQTVREALDATKP